MTLHITDPPYVFIFILSATSIFHHLTAKGLWGHRIMESQSLKGLQDSTRQTKWTLTMSKALCQIPWVKEGEQDQVSAFVEAADFRFCHTSIKPSVTSSGRLRLTSFVVPYSSADHPHGTFMLQWNDLHVFLLHRLWVSEGLGQPCWVRQILQHLS